MPKKKYAPIVLFVYARPEHTKKTVEALKLNTLADISDLIIYSDSAREEKDLVSVNNVREIVKNIEGFKSVEVIERKSNYGLAKNIIEGVTEVCDRYGKVIVLEDDIVTAPSFLLFMNNALDYYQNELKVWHISGWNYPIKSNGMDDYFFWRVMNCWGWATWSDRWSFYDKDPSGLIERFTKQYIDRFNLDGNFDFWSQVVENNSGLINTWAVFWYAAIFENKGLCLNPVISFVNNIGCDGSGENSKSVDDFGSELNSEDVSFIGVDVKESEYFVKEISFFYKSLRRSMAVRVYRKLRSFFL